MNEFFIQANSFAAPFFSDTSEEFIKASTPEEALEKFAQNYDHPAGLYAAACYRDANTFHKGIAPLARWLCNHEIALREATKDKPGYSYLGHTPGEFEIDRELYKIPNPKDGKIVGKEKPPGEGG